MSVSDLILLVVARPVRTVLDDFVGEVEEGWVGKGLLISGQGGVPLEVVHSTAGGTDCDGEGRLRSVAHAFVRIITYK